MYYITAVCRDIFNLVYLFDCVVHSSTWSRGNVRGPYGGQTCWEIMSTFGNPLFYSQSTCLLRNVLILSTNVREVSNVCT